MSLWAAPREVLLAKRFCGQELLPNRNSATQVASKLMTPNFFLKGGHAHIAAPSVGPSRDHCLCWPLHTWYAVHAFISTNLLSAQSASLAHARSKQDLDSEVTVWPFAVWRRPGKRRKPTLAKTPGRTGTMANVWAPPPLFRPTGTKLCR